MKAAAFLGRHTVCWQEFADPKAIPGYCVVEVQASALCGSDLSAYYRSEKPAKVIPGHEFSGVVVDTAPDSPLSPGDRVAVYPIKPCGNCAPCRHGMSKFCRQPESLGWNRDGGFAQRVLVPEESCERIPTGVTFEQAALCGDAMGVPFGALDRIQARPGETVAVFGAGPVGLAVTMAASRTAFPWSASAKPLPCFTQAPRARSSCIRRAATSAPLPLAMRSPASSRVAPRRNKPGSGPTAPSSCA